MDHSLACGLAIIYSTKQSEKAAGAFLFDAREWRMEAKGLLRGGENLNNGILRSGRGFGLGEK